MATPIPQPPALPLLGNVRDINSESPLLSLMHLAEKYGPIFKLSFFGKERFFVSSAELANELCDEKRFCKSTDGALEALRPGLGPGLFTAHHGEHEWEIAHRTLVPAFGPIGIKEMFDEMHDIAAQLVSKWARSEGEIIDVTDNYTRLTLDSIALCAMGARFNSFYHDEMHPFVNAMVEFLVEGGARVRRSRLESLLNPQYERKFQENIALQRSICKELIADRRANPNGKKDLLNAVLFGKDPKTGEKLSDEVMVDNLVTFMIAGHETTSGMLSFATYFLIKNPEEMQKLQEEVDRVVGAGPITYQHMAQLPNIEAALRESLRLWPTASIFTVKPLNPQGPVIIGGQYELPAGASVAILSPGLGRDTSVYGPDVEVFRSERMSSENFAKLPPNAWKPFGNGMRGCIGRPFAWQEAILALALVVQNFNLTLADPSYELKIKQTLTIKPDNLYIKARLRQGIDPVGLERRLFGATTGANTAKKQETKIDGSGTTSRANLKPMTILFGSNSGTCEGLAQSLASGATSQGFAAHVDSLDSAVDNFPKDHPVVIISASYEGNPPDNAAAFYTWLHKADGTQISGSQVAVFGCGHQDWVSTYQRIPTTIDKELVSKGAKAIIQRGETNVAAGTIFDDFDAWTEKLWSELSTVSGEDAQVESLDMELSTNARASHLRHSVQDARVIKNDLLTKPGAPEKRHMEFQLPTNMTYEAGDYLALLPVNNTHTISRILRRFGLPWDAQMKLAKSAHTTIPTEREMSVTVVLGAYVELNSPATRKNLAALTKFAGHEINDIQNPSFPDKTLSVISILEKYPDINLPFAVYLSMLPPMRIRQYSISSSPLVNPSVASISYSVVDADGHLGVTTNYLKSLTPGTTVQLAIKKSSTSFHLPSDESTPIIMIGAGTGLAPFRGFMQERAVKMEAGKKLGEAALFLGCRNPEEDRIYASEIDAWQKDGVAKVYYAFSRCSEKSDNCKYAQDRVFKEKEVISDLFSKDAKVFICGNAALGRGVGSIAAKMHKAKLAKEGSDISDKDAEDWWESLRGKRFTVDVFD